MYTYTVDVALWTPWSNMEQTKDHRARLHKIAWVHKPFPSNEPKLDNQSLCLFSLCTSRFLESIRLKCCNASRAQCHTTSLPTLLGLSNWLRPGTVLPIRDMRYNKDAIENAATVSETFREYFYDCTGTFYSLL
jgi:hypothetical protein